VRTWAILVFLCIILFAFDVPVRAASHLQLVPDGWPKTVVISRISVKANVEPLSFTKPADFDAPYRWGDVGWFSRGVKPGDLGHAVMLGHLDSLCCPAVFWNLSTLTFGDTVQVGYRDSRTLSFRVMWRRTYSNDSLPSKWMFATVHERGLILYTCAGIFHRPGGYDHKVLIYARLVLPSGRLG
jgi:sortase A